MHLRSTSLGDILEKRFSAQRYQMWVLSALQQCRRGCTVSVASLAMCTCGLQMQTRNPQGLTVVLTCCLHTSENYCKCMCDWLLIVRTKRCKLLTRRANAIPHLQQTHVVQHTDSPELRHRHLKKNALDHANLCPTWGPMLSSTCLDRRPFTSLSPLCCFLSCPFPRSDKATHLRPDAVLHLQQMRLVQRLGLVRQRRQPPARESNPLKPMACGACICWCTKRACLACCLWEQQHHLIGSNAAWPDATVAVL